MPTPYKVFLSVPNDPEALTFLGAARTAVWRMDQMMISAMSASDVVGQGDDRIMLAKQAMDTTALFIGVYGRSYGTIPTGATTSYAEQEYRLAHQRGIVCAIFISQDAKDNADEKMQHFKAYLETHHVVVYFKDVTDLQAKVVLAVDTFLRTSRQMRLLPPREVNFAGEVSKIAAVTALPSVTPLPTPVSPITAPPPSLALEAPLPPSHKREESNVEKPHLEQASVSVQPITPSVNLESLVNESLKFAADDIEQIMRRALQVWDAQKQVLSEDERDGWLRINPLFGVPAQQSQFRSDVFMMMPFREPYNAIYQNVIRPVVGSLNLTLRRGDEFSSAKGVIMNEVWAAISGCRLVIAEVSEVNANVYYELGIAHTVGKPVILLTQATDADEVPFDIRHLRYIRYSNTIEGGEKLAKDLQQSIVWILNDLKEREQA